MALIRCIFLQGVRSSFVAIDGWMTTKPELIGPGSDERFVRRNEKGQFKESDDVGGSLFRRSPPNDKNQGKAW
ncbi:hypothetical protein [Rhizobium mongolense]|uniref:Uncharacterized protein n=1 Tax=Rhizobium mongolense TaxID=57676 RepID=A0A7W6RJU3_9HYPH|nr:hypothetical protein [Rhizobium mongolense]